MKRIPLLATLLMAGSVLFVSCSDSTNAASANQPAEAQAAAADQAETNANEIKPGDVQLTNPLNAQWVAAGKGIYEMKCQSCHKLTDEKLVGPGWKDVTKTREPHWIMNMIVNTDMMLEKDAEAQKLLEQCLVRMPNQSLTHDEARQVLEYMRSNDGEK